MDTDNSNDRVEEVLKNLHNKENAANKILDDVVDFDSTVGKLTVLNTHSGLMTMILDELQVNNIPISFYLTKES